MSEWLDGMGGCEGSGWMGWTDRPTDRSVCGIVEGRACRQRGKAATASDREDTPSPVISSPLLSSPSLSHTAHFTISPQLSSNGEKYSRTSDITNTQTDSTTAATHAAAVASTASGAAAAVHYAASIKGQHAASPSWSLSLSLEC